MQDTAGQADAEVQLAATLASLEAKASRDITTLFGSTLDAGFNAQLTLIKDDLASLRAATRELEILAEEQDTEEQSQRLLGVLKGHRSEYERLQAAFKQAHVQARRNTEAAAAAARKALLASAEAGRPAVIATANHRNGVAVSQGITQSLQRTRQLMAQELEHTSATLAALDASADRLQQGKEELQSHRGLFASSRRLLRTLFTSSILDAVSLYGGLAIFFLVVAYIVQKRTLYFAPVHRVVAPMAGSAWNHTRSLAARAHALAWNPGRLSTVQQRAMQTGSPDPPSGKPPGEWAEAKPDPFADLPPLPEVALPPDGAASLPNATADENSHRLRPLDAAATTGSLQHEGPADAASNPEPPAAEPVAGAAGDSAAREQQQLAADADANAAKDVVSPQGAPEPPEPTAAAATGAPASAEAAASSTSATEGLGLPHDAVHAAVPPQPLPIPEPAQPAGAATVSDAEAAAAAKDAPEQQSAASPIAPREADSEQQPADAASAEPAVSPEPESKEPAAAADGADSVAGKPVAASPAADSGPRLTTAQDEGKSAAADSTAESKPQQQAPDEEIATEERAGSQEEAELEAADAAAERLQPHSSMASDETQPAAVASRQAAHHAAGPADSETAFAAVPLQHAQPAVDEDAQASKPAAAPAAEGAAPAAEDAAAAAEDAAAAAPSGDAAIKQQTADDNASRIAGDIMPQSDSSDTQQRPEDATADSGADTAAKAAEDAQEAATIGQEESAADLQQVAGEAGQEYEWRWNPNKGRRGIWELLDSTGAVVQESEPEEESAVDVEPLLDSDDTSQTAAEVPANEEESEMASEEETSDRTGHPADEL